MHKDRTLCEQNEKEIEELLLGHKVTVDDYDNLVLDNGIMLQINPNITIIKILLSGFAGILIMFIGFAIAFFISNR